jgi:hypothetical protein
MTEKLRKVFYRVGNVVIVCASPIFAFFLMVGIMFNPTDSATDTTGPSYSRSDTRFSSSVFTNFLEGRCQGVNFRFSLFTYCLVLYLSFVQVLLIFCVLS